MSIRKYQAEQIVTVLRQIAVKMAHGKSTPQACQEAGIHTRIDYRWRRNTDGTAVDESRRCCGTQAGRWARIGCSESGVGKGCKCRKKQRPRRRLWRNDQEFSAKVRVCNRCILCKI